MKLTSKAFKIEVSVKIVERSTWRDKIPDMAFSFREHVPTTTHPVNYLRQRLSEEIQRHASQVDLKSRQPVTGLDEL